MSIPIPLLCCYKDGWAAQLKEYFLKLTLSVQQKQKWFLLRLKPSINWLLFDIKISNKDQYILLEKFKKKYDDYWESRRLVQRSLDDWSDGPQSYGISFRLMPKL